MQSIKELFKKHKIIKTIIFSIIGIWVAFFIVVPLLAWIDFKPLTLVNFGVFGDSFNIITSLFTGLALVGVVISIYLQTEELKEQRKELELQREELKNNTAELQGQKEQLELQRQEMTHQNFNTQFFQMLNIFNTNVANLETDSSIKNSEISAGNCAGKRVISQLKAILFYKIIENSKLWPDATSENPNPENFKKIFNEFNQYHNNILRPYFINLYQILEYVDDNAPEEQAEIYTNIIRAQLSLDELILLLYNAIPFGGEKYKKLLEKYAFFRYLPDIDEDRDDIHFNLYMLKQYDSKVVGENKELKEYIEKLQKPS